MRGSIPYTQAPFNWLEFCVSMTAIVCEVYHCDVFDRSHLGRKLGLVPCYIFVSNRQVRFAHCVNLCMSIYSCQHHTRDADMVSCIGTCFGLVDPHQWCADFVPDRDSNLGGLEPSDRIRASFVGKRLSPLSHRV